MSINIKLGLNLEAKHNQMADIPTLKNVSALELHELLMRCTWFTGVWSYVH